jgi:hypothetical protein
MKKIERHPLNAAGDFFVECDSCMSCDASPSEAPELTAYDEDGHCYFKRQPRTPEELEHAISAVRFSCVEAVLYEGSDPEILRKINAPFYVNQVKKSDAFREWFFDKIFKFFG